MQTSLASREDAEERSEDAVGQEVAERSIPVGRSSSLRAGRAMLEARGAGEGSGRWASRVDIGSLANDTLRLYRPVDPHPETELLIRKNCGSNEAGGIVIDK